MIIFQKPEAEPAALQTVEEESQAGPSPSSVASTVGTSEPRISIRGGSSPAPTIDPVSLLLADKRSPATRRAYAADLVDFFGHGYTHAEVTAFFALDAPGTARRLVAYKAGMLERGLAEATVNRRLAAVRSLLKFNFRLGLSRTDGHGLVDSEKARAYRDTRGIDLESLRQLLRLPEQLHGAGTVRAARDSALLRLLMENALRRAEICALDVDDFSPAQLRLQILGKGRGSQKEPVTVSEKGEAAITAYLTAAGHTEGALFRGLARRWTLAQPERAGGRLSADGLHDLVGRYGQALGVKLTPHKLRHSAITAALDASGGNVRKVQKLSRHADLRTLTVYDDNRTDAQGEMTGLLSGLL